MLLRLTGTPPEQAPPRAMCVHAGQYPFPVPPFQLDIDRLGQPPSLDVDKAVAQQVSAQQDLAGAPLELTQVKAGTGELKHIAIEGADLLHGHEYLPSSDTGHPAYHQRQLRAAQPDDHVGNPPQRLTVPARDRAFDQLR